MARDSGGTYTLATGNPVSTGTTISSTTHNNTNSDIATELTDSLCRSGKGAMLAPLQLANGTVSLPSLTFGTDPDTGVYRVGANNLGIAVNGTNAVDISTTVVTVPLGLVVAQDTANAAAVTATGNGSGVGGQFTGGGSSGDGLRGSAGAGAAFGVQGFGSGAGAGVKGTGGATGEGVLGVGGATSGVGGSFTASAGNSFGVSATGHGFGHGVSGTGGAADGFGGLFTGGATNGRGLTASGTGTGPGIVATGGSTANGITATGGSGGATAGIEATGGPGGNGGYFANGTAATGGTRRDALALTNGDLDMSGVTYPTSTTAIANRLTPSNIPKAWACISTPGGASTTATVNGGFNITSASVADDILTVVLAADMANTSCAALVTARASGAQLVCFATLNDETTILISAYSLSGAGIYDIQAGASQSFFLAVFGEQ